MGLVARVVLKYVCLAILLPQIVPNVQKLLEKILQIVLAKMDIMKIPTKNVNYANFLVKIVYQLQFV